MRHRMKLMLTSVVAVMLCRCDANGELSTSAERENGSESDNKCYLHPGWNVGSSHACHSYVWCDANADHEEAQLDNRT